jgi:hypothetical protein
MGPREVILSAVVPAVASVVVLVALRVLLGRAKTDAARPTESGSHDASGGRAEDSAMGPISIGAVFVLLVGAGTVLGSYAWQSSVELWAASVTHRFPAVALAATLVGLVSVLTPLGRSAIGSGVLGATGGGVVGWMILSALHESLIGETERWAWIVGTGLIAGAQAWAVRVGSRALPGWGGPGLLWLLAGVTALGATAGLANAPLVLWPTAGAAFGLAAAGLLRRGTDLVGPASPAIATVFMGVLAMSHWIGDQERWVMFALLSAAPLGLALAAIPALGSRPIWVRLIPAGVVSLGLAGAQAAVAVPALLEATTGSGGGEYYDD